MSRQYFPMNVLVAACIFVLATLYSLSIVQQANAYTVYSLAKWATVPNSSQRIPRYTESNLYIQYAGNSGWVPSLRDAIAQWNEQSKYYNWFFWWRYDTNNPQYVVTISYQNCGADCLASTERFPGNPPDTLANAVTSVAVGNGQGYWDGVNPPSFPANWYDLRSLLRHEIGHAEGDCHSGISGNLMYPTIPLYTIKTIQSNDFAGIRYLYYPQSNPNPPELNYYYN